MKKKEPGKSLEQLEAELRKHEAEMTTDFEQLEINEEIERSASFFTPLFVAILFAIAIYLIDKLVVI
jgi:hypothetical protein